MAGRNTTQADLQQTDDFFDRKADDLQKALGGFNERHLFDAHGQMDQFDKDMEDWEQSGNEGPAPRFPLPPGNQGMETGNFPAPEGVDVDPITELLGVPEGFQFPAPPPVQGPQDYPDNTPPTGPFNNPFGPGPNPPPLGPFPFPTTPKIPPPPLPPQR